jgi:hypothetical protein
MAPDGPSDQQGEQPTVPARQASAAAERSARRRRLLDAQDFAQEISFLDPKVRFRYRLGMRDGSLHPSIEKALLDIAWGKPQALDKRLLDALGATHRGLFTLLLRKPLTEDPLAEPKPVQARVIIDQPKQEEAVPTALPARPSIIPPSRPSKRQQGKATLKPGEEELT